MLGGGLLQVANRGRVGCMQMSRPRANATGGRAENKQSAWVGGLLVVQGDVGWTSDWACSEKE